MGLLISTTKSMQGKLELISSYSPFTSDLKHIENDCMSGHFEEAALRFKKIATNCKSLDVDVAVAKKIYVLIAKEIDEHLQSVLMDYQYACFRVALAKVRDAKLVMQDLRI